MDDFKKKLTARQLLIGAGLLVLFCAFMLSRHYVKAAPDSDYITGFIEGFQVGLLTALLAALLYYLVRNLLALRNPEKLKKLYIAETDERKQFIQRQAGSIGMNIVMFGLAAGAVIAGNMNDTVFFTLMGACVFVALIRAFLKIYYKNKY